MLAILKRELKVYYTSLFAYVYYAIFFCTITVIIFQDPNITYDRYELFGYAEYDTSGG